LSSSCGHHEAEVSEEPGNPTEEEGRRRPVLPSPETLAAAAAHTEPESHHEEGHPEEEGNRRLFTPLYTVYIYIFLYIVHVKSCNHNVRPGGGGRRRRPPRQAEEELAHTQHNGGRRQANTHKVPCWVAWPAKTKSHVLPQDSL